MLIGSRRTHSPAAAERRPRPRRGVALVFVMVFVIAMAALAMSSIFMASSTNLLAKSHNRERDLRYAAEQGLAIGKARVNKDPSILVMPVDTLFRQMLFSAPIKGADGKDLPGVAVNLFVGQTGSSSGQNGRFASIVAQAVDTRGVGVNGNGFIRRLELTQESFAKFAYWSDAETNNGTTIYFNNDDHLWGPVWSNDGINIGSGGATFHDQVGTAKTIVGKNYGIFTKTPQENQAIIALPSTAALALLSGYASAGNTSLATTSGPNNNESQVLDRIEFVAFDTDASGDSTGDNEGFYRYYRGKGGNEAAVRGDWPVPYGSMPTVDKVTQCGDWHWAPRSTPQLGAGDTTRLKFYPVSVHNTTWFRNQIDSGLVARGFTQAAADKYADAEKIAALGPILDSPNARCYLAGDPHLVAIDRVPLQVKPAPQVGSYTTFDVNKGGEDTTFTPVGRFGAWQQVSITSFNTPITLLRPWDARYLTPLGRKFNTNVKGVIYAPGNVGVSGIVNGLVTLYAKGSIVILDDIRYTNDPVKSVCHDILGMISSADVVVADNALNSPPQTYPSGTKKYFSLDDTKDLYIHSVIMALGTSFRVERYGSGPVDANDCDAQNNGRGCIYLSGGLIQKSRGAVGQGTANGIGATGFAKRYTYDHCAVVKPPPYFPTTGRFQDNRYLELDPANFVPLTYFKSITPDGP
ncbi:MAG: hypothetical protein JWN79_978 [Gemmatimonadetes bacterium]|jgi:hypothetical protein|nr:hypothetical protein [Gemmatimonadota bacterium]